MEVKIQVIHVGDIGDRPVELSMNDVNRTNTVNMDLNGEHYRINLDELEKLIKAMQASK